MSCSWKLSPHSSDSLFASISLGYYNTIHEPITSRDSLKPYHWTQVVPPIWVQSTSWHRWWGTVLYCTVMFVQYFPHWALCTCSWFKLTRHSSTAYFLIFCLKMTASHSRFMNLLLESIWLSFLMYLKLVNFTTIVSYSAYNKNSFTTFQRSSRVIFKASVTSSHLVLGHSCLLWPYIFPKSYIPIIWLKCFKNPDPPKKNQAESIKMDLFDLLAFHGILKKFVQHDSSNASIFFVYLASW